MQTIPPYTLSPGVGFLVGNNVQVEVAYGYPRHRQILWELLPHV